MGTKGIYTSGLCLGQMYRKLKSLYAFTGITIHVLTTLLAN